MSGDAVGIFGKARRMFSCLAGSNDSMTGAESHGNGKARGQPAGAPGQNGSAAFTYGGANIVILRHNPIDVCLTSGGEVSVLQGNPSQRTFEASWCGVPVHLHVLTFVKRPNPIAQLPGPASPHATVAAVLDTPPPAQANMLTQPDMVAVATEVEAALVQLIAEPSPQVLPVLACAKVTSRAHIGSPGDEHVTQRIVAEVHIVTPRLPGLVSLPQWLQQRWPQCEVNTAAPVTTTATATATIHTNNVAAAAAPAAPNHRLATASTGPGAAQTAATAPGAAAARGGGAAAAAGAATAAVGVGRGPVPGPSASLLGVSQPIAEGFTPRDSGVFAGLTTGLRAEQHGGTGAGAAADATAGAALTAAHTSSTEKDGSGGVAPACTSCFALRFAPPVPPPPPPPPPALRADAAPGGAAASRHQQHEGGRAAAPGAAGAVAGGTPAAAGEVVASGPRRLAGPSNTTGLGRAQRFPLPPPPVGPTMPVHDALEVLICLAEALRHLHRRGLTHGSLTPKSIQLQLVDADPAVAAAAGGVRGQRPAAQGSSQGSCQDTQQSQPRTPGHASGQREGQASREGAGTPSPGGGPPSAACDSAVVSPFISTKAEEGEGAGTAVVTTAASTSPAPVTAAGAVLHAAPAGAVAVGDEGRSRTDAAGPAPSAAEAGAGAEASAATASGAVPVAADDTLPAVAPADDAPEAAAAVTGGGSGAAATASCCAVTGVAGEGSPSSAGTPAAAASPALPPGPDAAVAAAGGSDASQQQQQQRPAAPVVPGPSSQRPKPVQPARRRQQAPVAPAGTLRAVLSLPSVGPALLQMQTWGRARPAGLSRDHLVWCAPELLNAGGTGWGLPLLPLRSGNGNGSGSGNMGMLGLGPLDTSIGCRGGNRLRGGNHHNHQGRHFGDGSYGGSLGVGVGGNGKRQRYQSPLLMGLDSGVTAAHSANGIAPSCDVYSLGMLMWYLVSGQVPFQHLATQDQVLRVKEMGGLDEQLPFSQELPAGYIQLARRCWAPLPMQRPNMNVVLSEMRFLRVQVLGLSNKRDPTGEHGYGHGGSSMGEMTGDSRLSFTLSLPLSSRDLSNGEEYSLVPPPLELAFGVNDASGDGGGASGAGGTAGGSTAGGGGAAGGGSTPPPPLKSSLPASLLTALTAPRRGSVGGGRGELMDDDDNYSDTDRFTEHTEASGGGTPYSSPLTASTTGRGASGVTGAGARVRAAAAAAAAAASTARSFRLVRVGLRPGSTAGSVGRSGGSGATTALLGPSGSRRGASHTHGHAPGNWGSIGDVGSSLAVGGQPAAAAGTGTGIGIGSGFILATHPSSCRVPSPSAAASPGAVKNRRASSSALMGLSAVAAAGGSCCAGGAAATSGSGDSGGAPGSTGGGAAASSGSRASGIVTVTSGSNGCLALTCGNCSGIGSE